MHYLGLRYSFNKKTYYTDGHEREDVVDDRNNRFLEEYFDLELKTYRWVQVIEATAITLELEHDDFPSKVYYEYSVGDDTYREYHIDTHNSLVEFILPENVKYGGNLSHRLPVGSRPIMILGQDESTFNQLIFSSRYWQGPKGMSFITPKSTGEILMISGYQAREFGLGLRSLLTAEILAIVNSNRKGTKYRSEKDAKLLYNKVQKEALTDDPSLRYFEAGVNRQGYWTNSHCKLQLEDLNDCLRVIYPSFDFAILFDQSSGHCKVRDDGLVANKMNVKYGGRVRNMRDSKIKDIGEFNGTLKAGDIQNMNFKEGDEGPFWLSPMQALSKKYDVVKDTVKT